MAKAKREDHHTRVREEKARRKKAGKVKAVARKRRR